MKVEVLSWNDQCSTRHWEFKPDSGRSTSQVEKIIEIKAKVTSQLHQRKDSHTFGNHHLRAYMTLDAMTWADID